MACVRLLLLLQICVGITLDPVSAVSVSVSSVSSSSQSCNFTVICQTEELYNISSSFTCDNTTCEELRPQHSGHAPSGPSF
ncbi:hypothetical protein WMY93_000644 [Mugilogobius chulae]|uniref:Uncharacterized protein n=1 Tax=Mugilogobius chulae TaxID=88201 RepID=A0AAW0PZW9_9GOBI